MQIEKKQETLLDDMYEYNKNEKAECQAIILELEAEMQKLKDEAMDERKAKEDEAWEDIDELVDKNKAELATLIEGGMESKAKLSEEMVAYSSLCNHKEQQVRDFM